jgi:hypothetical protein
VCRMERIEKGSKQFTKYYLKKEKEKIPSQYQ